MSSLWLKIQENLQKQLNHRLPLLSFLQVVSLKQGSHKEEFVLNVPSQLHKERAKTHLIPLLKKEIHNILGYRSQIQIQIKPRPLSSQTFTKKPLLTRETPKPKPKNLCFFNPHYTFENFISGSTNEHAFYAIKDIAKKPLNNPNSPLFIYGNTGMGKTHLLNALGHELSQKFSNIQYVSAERFLQECVTAIRTQKMDAFKQKYREECQILLIDDIQAIQKGSVVQEEFFHTFNAIKDRGGLVVCTCDCLPREIKNFQTRLQTRLSGGIIFEINPPNLETRMAILQKKSELKSLHLSQEALSFIAENSHQSVRELEGHLNKIKMICDLQKQKPSLNFVKTILSFKETVSVEGVIEEVASRYHVSVQQICSLSKSRSLSYVRKQAILAVRQKFPHLSLSAIGQCFGGRSHSTILYALSKKAKK